MIVLGACVASVRDLSFSSYGYLTVFLSNFTTAVYLATIARLGGGGVCAPMYEWVDRIWEEGLLMESHP